MLIRALVSFQGFSGLSEDRFVNTIYVDAGPPLVNDPGFDLPGNLELTNGDQGLDGDVAIGPSIAGNISSFYTQDRSTSRSVGFYMAGSSMKPGIEATIKLYRMADPEKRAPFYTANLNILQDNSANVPIPAEVALCLSFNAVKASGQVAARRRGRIYIGPLGTQCMNTPSVTTVWASRPSDECMQTLLEAGRAFGQGLRTAGHKWVIHSPTTGPLARYEVAGVSVDNAFDTIRSRGPAPTARLAATLTA